MGIEPRSSTSQLLSISTTPTTATGAANKRKFKHIRSAIHNNKRKITISSQCLNPTAIISAKSQKELFRAIQELFSLISVWNMETSVRPGTQGTFSSLLITSNLVPGSRPVGMVNCSKHEREKRQGAGESFIFAHVRFNRFFVCFVVFLFCYYYLVGSARDQDEAILRCDYPARLRWSHSVTARNWALGVYPSIVLVTQMRLQKKILPAFRLGHRQFGPRE